MKKPLLIFSFFFFVFFVSFRFSLLSQNLVPNPSFEDTNYCPTGFSDLPASKFWYKPTQGSSDYFNACNNSDVGVPFNLFGVQNARTGNAYAGWAVCYDTLPFCDLHYREYLQIQLLSALTAGKKYIVSAYFAKADSTPMVLKNTGIAISDTTIGGNYLTPIPYAPQIIYPQFLTDTDWVEISDTIISTGGEKYLTIGNFNYNNISDTMSLFYGSMNYNMQGYYYVDDVSVIEDTTTGVSELFAEQNVTIYTINGILFLQLDIEVKVAVEINNLIGQVVYYENANSLTNRYSFNLSELIKGIYFLQIKTDNTIASRKFFLNK